MFPSALRATLIPRFELDLSDSISWLVQTPPRMNTQAAPPEPLATGAPISAVSPSEESATLEPKLAGLTGLLSFSTVVNVDMSLPLDGM